jgi:chemotaxis-related protein WspD
MKLDPQPQSKSAGAAPQTEQLLNRELSADYVAGWTERLASARDEVAPTTHSAVVFRIDSEWLALPTTIFQEVVPRPSLHVIPHRNDSPLAGLAVVRGELLLCINLSRVLGLARASAPEAKVAARLLVVRRGSERTAFEVDEVCRVVRYLRGELQPVPSTLSSGEAAFSAGILQFAGHSVAFLDEERLFHHIARSLA